jgi:ornithine cyclodeaminase
MWIREQDVVDTVDLPAAIDAVEAALRSAARGTAHCMEKTHVAWGDGHTLHAIGAVDDAAGLVATKTWAHTGGGATPLLVVWDAEAGLLLAIIEAFALGQLRTGAMTGVAARWLAPTDATTAALIGTGKQGAAQLAAMAEARALDVVAVYSPNGARRHAFVERARAERWTFEVREAESVEDAVAGAQVVTTATRATEPFLHSAAVAPGTLVNAVGAITPERAELTADLIARSDLVVADSPTAAARLASELRGRNDVVGLDSVVAGEQVRPPAQLTVFKAMGIGLADLAIGRLVLERCRADGRGANIDHPQRAAPRLRAGDGQGDTR